MPGRPEDLADRGEAYPGGSPVGDKSKPPAYYFHDPQRALFRRRWAPPKDGEILRLNSITFQGAAREPRPNSYRYLKACKS